MNVHGTDYEQNDHTALDRDITLIKSLGFTIKSLSWIVDAYRREDWTALNHPVIAISFDDAPDIEAYSYCDLRFNEMVESFHSIIARHHVPATSFLIASEAARTQIAQHGAPEPPNLYSSDWWNNTKDTLLDLANHSWDHNHEHVSPVAQKEQTKGNFFAIDNEADAIAQITTAHNHLKAATKDRVKPLFCYPYGHVNEYLRDNFFAMRPDLHEMHAAFSTAGEHFTENHSIWAIPRYVCGHHWRSTAELEEILTQ
ncbi:polysaccharide deacetylase family protein [Neptunomonas marina]|nr:polysaccharide deacetylase family protein [Neptunomonas marina]